MKKFMLTMLLLLFFVTPSFSGLYYIKALTVAELEEFDPGDNSGLELNNFMLKESRSFMVKDKEVATLSISFSAVNKGNTARHFSVMLVAMDEKNRIIWGDTLEPMMSTLSSKSTETIKSSFYVGTGTLDKTTRIIFKIVGD